MQTENKEIISKARLIDLFKKKRTFLIKNDTPVLVAKRDKAFASFEELGFPDTSMEAWRLTDLEESFARGYDYHLQPMKEMDIQKVFRCNIPLVANL